MLGTDPTDARKREAQHGDQPVALADGGSIGTDRHAVPDSVCHAATCDGRDTGGVGEPHHAAAGLGTDGPGSPEPAATGTAKLAGEMGMDSSMAGGDRRTGSSGMDRWTSAGTTVETGTTDGNHDEHHLCLHADVLQHPAVPRTGTYGGYHRELL